MAKRVLPSQKVLRQLLEYDAHTGALRWKARGAEWFAADERLTSENKMNAWNARNAGRLAFTALDGKGYLQGQVCGYHTTAHRVVWVMHHGEWPTCLDHIDGNRTNNRIENLRAVTLQQNSQNTKTPRSNTSGHIGVRFRQRSNRWEAMIGSRGQKYLGSFRTMEEAVAARLAAQARLGFHANHGRRLDGVE